MAVKDWSTTAASNTGIISGMSLDGSVMTVNQTDNAFRDFAAQIASQLGKMGFEGADIASAATTNLANATGWSLDITGTTTITAFGTVDAGQVFILRFTGALTLTHNATSLILPGAANITTAAGDVAFMKSEGSGNWRCIAYQRASGSLVTIAGLAVTDGNFIVGNGTTWVAESGATVRASMGLVSSSTDNGVPRFDGTTGAMQTSGVTIDDTAAITLSGSGPNITFTDTDTNGDSRIQGNSATGSLTIASDVNNEVANSVIVFQIDGSTVGTWASGGDLTVTGDITASSDERLKKDWAELSGGFISQLAGVKAGTYTRTDTGARQVGVSAQALRDILPEAVHEGDDGMLSVAYGHAALIACVHLAREVATLRSELEQK